MVPRLLARLQHEAVVEEVPHFDYLRSGNAEGGGVAFEETGFVYVLMMAQDVKGFVWLEPARTCTAADSNHVRGRKLRSKQII